MAAQACRNPMGLIITAAGHSHCQYAPHYSPHAAGYTLIDSANLPAFCSFLVLPELNTGASSFKNITVLPNFLE